MGFLKSSKNRKKRAKRIKRRLLRFEQLDSRELLCANPLGVCNCPTDWGMNGVEIGNDLEPPPEEWFGGAPNGFEINDPPGNGGQIVDGDDDNNLEEPGPGEGDGNQQPIPDNSNGGTAPDQTNPVPPDEIDSVIDDLDLFNQRGPYPSSRVYLTELEDALEQDPTDTREYNEDSYNCYHFARDLQYNLWNDHNTESLRVKVEYTEDGEEKTHHVIKVRVLDENGQEETKYVEAQSDSHFPDIESLLQDLDPNDVQDIHVTSTSEHPVVRPPVIKVWTQEKGSTNALWIAKNEQPFTVTVQARDEQYRPVADQKVTVKITYTDGSEKTTTGTTNSEGMLLIPTSSKLEGIISESDLEKSIKVEATIHVLPWQREGDDSRDPTETKSFPIGIRIDHSYVPPSFNEIPVNPLIHVGSDWPTSNVGFSFEDDSTSGDETIDLSDPMVTVEVEDDGDNDNEPDFMVALDVEDDGETFTVGGVIFEFDGANNVPAAPNVPCTPINVDDETAVENDQPGPEDEGGEPPLDESDYDDDSYGGDEPIEYPPMKIRESDYKDVVDEHDDDHHVPGPEKKGDDGNGLADDLPGLQDEGDDGTVLEDDLPGLQDEGDDGTGLEDDLPGLGSHDRSYGTDLLYVPVGLEVYNPSLTGPSLPLGFLSSDAQTPWSALGAILFPESPHFEPCYLDETPWGLVPRNKDPDDEKRLRDWLSPPEVFDSAIDSPDSEKRSLDRPSRPEVVDDVIDSLVDELQGIVVPC